MVSKISNMQRCPEYYRRRCRLRPATLRLHWGAVELVARALLAHGELSGPEVQRVLEHGNGFLMLSKETGVSSARAPGGTAEAARRPAAGKRSKPGAAPLPPPGHRLEAYGEQIA